MRVKNHAMGHHGVHGGFDGRTSVPLRGIDFLLNALLYLCQWYRDHDVFPPGVGHPFSRRFDPEKAAQLYGSVASAPLCKQGIAANPRGQCQQGYEFGLAVPG
jgi:hypothetical protein